MELWLESWYDAADHALSISETTDVSFIGSGGGVVRRPSDSAEAFRAAADFPAEWGGILHHRKGNIRVV